MRLANSRLLVVTGWLCAMDWGYTGIMENKMETSVVGYIGFRRVQALPRAAF